MEGKGYLLLLLSVVVLTCSSVETKAATAKTTHLPSFNRSSFPAGFIFGASSASYQYEGAAKEGGKGPSIWDTFTHKYPGKIKDGSNGDVAVDFYHRYKEDVALMKHLGFEGFRFSISWPRLLPRGKLSGGVNREGVDFYNNLINELLAKGIKPFVTLFHWDLPQALEDEYGGFLSPHVVKDFQDFAELCFEEFGDRVKHWMTMNEPWIFVQDGYEKGVKAPGRCSPWKLNNCPAGNSGTEPYVAGHHMLLCHAASVKVYKEKYQASQKGQIGIALVTHWMVPYSNMKADLEATQRALDFMYGWFFHPIVYGDYPRIMHTLVGKRLPKFTPEQSMLLKGSYDFIGLNYYTANYAANAPFFNRVNLSSSTDFHINLTTERNGIPIGPRVRFWKKHVEKKTWIQITSTDVSAFCLHPKGLHDLLVYTKEKYNNPTIYITENGMGEANNRTTMEGVKDPLRIKFYRDHLLAVHRAIKEGVKVKGFLAWSFLDNFEWNSGYTVRFGINYVDYKDGQKRYPKQSALWFKEFLLK